tara:strand:+ start:390 stop:575 length:186 start_codon:yes stop_codon:yes gene_type:complete
LNEIYFDEGAGIKGDKIVCTARKISKPIVLPSTGRHKIQRITLWENAFAVIDKKIRFFPDK